MKLGEVELQVLAHVADLIDEDVPALELPLAAGTPEGVAVAAADDRLQRQVGRLLEHHERRPGGRGVGALVDVDDDVGREMTGAQRSVGVHAVGVDVERLDRVGSLDRANDSFVGDATVGEEQRDAVEVGRVDALDVAVHERGDRVVALPGTGTHAHSSFARSIARVTNVPFATRITLEASFIGVMGLEIDELAEVGLRTARLPVVPGVCQPMGIVHGGIYAAIAETLASMGTADGVLDSGKVPLGMSNNTSFLRPVSSGSVHAEARAIHRGRTTWLWDVAMRGDDGKLCATSRVTIAVRDPLA